MSSIFSFFVALFCLHFETDGQNYIILDLQKLYDGLKGIDEHNTVSIDGP